MDEQTGAAQFTIDLTPAEPALEATGRMDFTKTWTGDLSGTSRGVMLSAGDPSSGNAGYVALETFSGSVGGREGGFALIQFGTMAAGDASLRYQIAPGSGTGELASITGVVDLTIVDGVHHVTLDYQL